MPAYTGPSPATVAKEEAEREATGRDEARIGRVFASSITEDFVTRCYIGTITALFKNHFRVTTRGGTNVKVAYVGATMPNVFAETFESWDTKASSASVHLLP